MITIDLKIVVKKRRGIVDYTALEKEPEKHELYTANYFAYRGFNVVFIRPSNIKGSHSPDFCLNGRIWETKSPIKYSESSFEDNFKKAEKQSENVIYDLRRLRKKDEVVYLRELLKRSSSNKIKNLLVIDKNEELLTIKGSFGNIKA